MACARRVRVDRLLILGALISGYMGFPADVPYPRRLLRQFGRRAERPGFRHSCCQIGVLRLALR